ncbi:MAG: helix-turn-helix transcriptional regulator [Alphaproteobacteria bacterium]|nr:helix-turn-helix transcriptional regulator [Alphaproteobacteria bacterium]
MISHMAIWSGIDELARRHGLSVSGLARLAGLDATAFNKSKRVSKDGRERWPSTESIAKILSATGESFDQFLTRGGAYGEPGGQSLLGTSSVPLLGFAQAGTGGYFDSGGFPAGQGWDEVELPSTDTASAYALEVSGDSMLPLYRDGDIIIVSPTEQVRRGDRVVVKTRDGEVMAKILHRQTTNLVELHSLNPEHPPRTVAAKDVDWIARIVWASQ